MERSRQNLTNQWIEHLEYIDHPVKVHKDTKCALMYGILRLVNRWKDKKSDLQHLVEEEEVNECDLE
jgi:hypothetical protein